jgi:hypothetical protein
VLPHLQRGCKVSFGKICVSKESGAEQLKDQVMAIMSQVAQDDTLRQMGHKGEREPLRALPPFV